jgi:catechol 2,3-dioxygenase-like lactoylglutathione lyase family enzyme
MKPFTIVYVTDMERSLAWYRSLLPDAALVSTSPYWSELSFGPASVALHSAAEVATGTQLGFALEADQPLEDILSSLTTRDVVVSKGISDEPFGRSMVIRDPDGLAIQINEHDPARYPTAAEDS